MAFSSIATALGRYPKFPNFTPTEIGRTPIFEAGLASSSDAMNRYRAQSANYNARQQGAQNLLGTGAMLTQPLWMPWLQDKMGGLFGTGGDGTAIPSIASAIRAVSGAGGGTASDAFNTWGADDAALGAASPVMSPVSRFGTANDAFNTWGMDDAALGQSGLGMGSAAGAAGLFGTAGDAFNTWGLDDAALGAAAPVMSGSDVVSGFGGQNFNSGGGLSDMLGGGGSGVLSKALPFIPAIASALQGDYGRAAAKAGIGYMFGGPASIAMSIVDMMGKGGNPTPDWGQLPPEGYENIPGEYQYDVNGQVRRYMEDGSGNFEIVPGPLRRKNRWTGEIQNTPFGSGPLFGS